MTRLIFSFVLTIFAVSQLRAQEATPTPAANLAPLPNPTDIQNSTEESIVPAEPVLALPEPSPSPDATTEGNVQPLPSSADGVVPGPGAAHKTERLRNFRQAKTAARLDPAIEALKTAAFASKTEQEKRDWLRAYYQATAKQASKGGEEVKEDAEVLNFIRQTQLSRPKTEHETQPLPQAPEWMTKLDKKTTEKAQATPTPEQ